MSSIDPEPDPIAVQLAKAEEAARQAETFRGRAKLSADNAAKAAEDAEAARQAASNRRLVTGSTIAGLIISGLTLVTTAGAVGVAFWQINRMKTDSRIDFTQSLYSDLSKKIEEFISDKDVGQHFAVPQSGTFDVNTVPTIAGNRLVMLFNLYDRYFALKQQSNDLITDYDWRDITTLLCGTLKTPAYAGALPYLKDALAKTAKSDKKAESNSASDPSGAQALQQLEECKA